MEKELRFDTCKVLALFYFHLWHTEKGSEYFSLQFLLQSSMDQCLSLPYSLSLFPISVLLKASVVYHECFTADISGWSASTFQSSCLIKAMAIIQQANCVDITNSLFFFCYLGLYIPLAFCRWGTLSRCLSHGQDLLLHHLRFYWWPDEQALTHSQEILDWPAAVQLPHQDLLIWYMSCTASPTARGSRWSKNRKWSLAKAASCHSLYGSLTSLWDLEGAHLQG